MSSVTCHALHATYHMPLIPTATVINSPPANSPTMHSMMVCEDQKIKFFFFFRGAIFDHF